MKVNWGALGITIGLILVAVSILAVGLMAGRRMSRLERALKEEIAVMREGMKRAIIVQSYALSTAESKKRGVSLEDLKEGYGLARQFMEE